MMRKLLTFILTNFGPLLLFYGANSVFGVKVAILASMIYSFIYIIFRRLKKLEISTFLIFSIVISLLFGIFDLYSSNAFLSKFESVIFSLFFAVYFGITLLGNRKPIVLDFAEQQGKIDPNDVDEDTLYFFRFLTAVWVAYYILKAIIYLWAGSNLTYEHRVAFTSMLGPISFWGLLFTTIAGSKYIWYILAILKRLPSTRNNSSRIDSQ